MKIMEAMETMKTMEAIGIMEAIGTMEVMEAMETIYITMSAPAAMVSIASTAAPPSRLSIDLSGTQMRALRWCSTTKRESENAGTRRGKSRGSRDKAAVSATPTKSIKMPSHSDS